MPPLIHTKSTINPKPKTTTHSKGTTLSIDIEQYTFKQTISQLITTQNLTKKIEKISVCDLACGTGTYTRILSEYFPEGEIIGIDLSQDMVDKANQIESLNMNMNKTSTTNNRIRYFKGDCLNLSLSDIFTSHSKFDLINACWLLNYASSVDILNQSIVNIKKILKPGGYFMGIIPNETSHPNAWKICKEFGITNIPKNGDYERDSYNIGENLLLVLFEPGNFVQPYKFEVDVYYYDDDTYRKAFEKAGFEFKLRRFVIDPENYCERYEKWLDYCGMVFEAKLLG